jgi:hypothetical protein
MLRMRPYLARSQQNSGVRQQYDSVVRSSCQHISPDDNSTMASRAVLLAMGVASLTISARVSAPAADACRTGLTPGDTARFVGVYRNFRPGGRTTGEVRMWSDGPNRIRYAETFDGNPASVWEGEIDIAPDATWQRFVWHSYVDGTLRNTQSAERIGDSAIAVSRGARTAERLPSGTLRLPGSIPAPAFAVMTQCALVRGREGFPTAQFGVIRVTKAITTNLRVPGKTKTVSLYAVSADSVPDLSHVWLDDRQRLFADPYADVGYGLPPDWTPTVEPLLLAEMKAAAPRMRQTAALFARPGAGIVFAHARLIDVEHGTASDNMSVVVRGSRIVAVGPDSAVKRPAGVTVVDVAGKTLMPGLWDFNPGYYTNSLGAIYDQGWRRLLSRGVTSIYEIHGDTTFAPRIVQRLERGEQVGPRLLTTCAIFGWVPDLIDGAVSRFRDAPNQVRNREDLRRIIARCAAQGRKWVNTYSTFPPELLPATIEEAQARGLRVMNTSSSRGGVAGGNVGTHVAQALFSIVSVDTNRTDWQLGRVGGAAQFWAYGRAVPDLDLDSPAVRAVVNRFAGGRLPTGTSLCVYPPTNRNMRAHDTTWDAATSKKLTEFVRLVHRAGATFLPGTEGACSLGRELQLLSQSGISNAELLSSVTIGAARFAELDREVGSITVGKRADIILVDGNPLTRLEDLDRVTMVMRDGALFRDLPALRAPLPFLPQPARK